MSRKTKTMTAVEMGRKGGRIRAERHSHIQIRAWGRLGGRPWALKETDVARLQRMLDRGMPHEEIAKTFRISLRTVGRYAVRLKAKTKFPAR